MAVGACGAGAPDAAAEGAGDVIVTLVMSETSLLLAGAEGAGCVWANACETSNSDAMNGVVQ